MKYRYEQFGGIIAYDDPPFLAFVDRQFMREIGADETPLWIDEERSIGVLTAPTEVHLSITNACPNGCAHCYMDSTVADPNELTTTELKHALDRLAEMGVFHVAMGGGEALTRPDVFEIAHHAREVGLVPNLTVSGSLLDEETAAKMTAFGQVNVSLDGVGEEYGTLRDPDMFDRADRALDLLIRAGVPTGVNCVVARTNFRGLPALFDYAADKGANEIEFLRFKPSGRGARDYESAKTTYQQNIELIPMLSRSSQEHGIQAKIDCSFVPMLCRHEPPIDYLDASATYGCEAGNVLIGAKSDGSVNGCSFLPPTKVTVFDVPERWMDSPELLELRSWESRAPEPCASCAYLAICKGGCRAVALHVHGSYDFPDPDCPWVVESRRDAERAST